MKKLLFFWKELTATFWFIPVLIIVFSIFLAVGFIALDSILRVQDDGWMKYLFVTNSDSARSILSTISGAMIGVAGTVFSVTLVALTLASSQFGPRLIKNFMYVRLNQVVLGSYVATYLYCLVVLNAITDSQDLVFIPSVSILIAIFFAVLNIILLIVFIHHIAVSIQADKVIADISNFMSRRVEVLFPEKMGEEIGEEEEVDLSYLVSEYNMNMPLRAHKSGYLQYLDTNSLIDVLARYDGVLLLLVRPGDYLVQGMEIGKIHVNAEWEDDQFHHLANQFLIGKTKTSQQDLEYSIHQMVEIASRALSPGVNDPYTAIACIDNLTNTMCYLAKVKFPSRYRFDKEEKLRVVANVLDFEGILDASFNQIRQFSEGSPSVMIRLMEAVGIIYNFTRVEQHRAAVRKHAEMVLNAGRRCIKESRDLNDLEVRSNKILT